MDDAESKGQSRWVSAPPGRWWIAIGAGLASAGVMVKARLAHLPGGSELPDARLAALAAASDMHLYHALAIIAVGLALAACGTRRLWHGAAGAFLIGILLFCVGIYADAAAMGLGFINPMGGILFMGGWIALAVGAIWR